MSCTCLFSCRYHFKNVRLFVCLLVIIQIQYKPIAGLFLSLYHYQIVRSFPVSTRVPQPLDLVALAGAAREPGTRSEEFPRATQTGAAGMGLVGSLWRSNQWCLGTKAIRWTVSIQYDSTTDVLVKPWKNQLYQDQMNAPSVSAQIVVLHVSFPSQRNRFKAIAKGGIWPLRTWQWGADPSLGEKHE